MVKPFSLQAGPADLRHFDPEFTQEAVSNSLSRTPDLALCSSSCSNAFYGFSYAQSEDDFLSGDNHGNNDFIGQ